MRKDVVALGFLLVACLMAFADEPDFFFSIEYKTAFNPVDELPVGIGTHWTYRNVYRSGIWATGKVITVTWESARLVRAHHVTPEGTVVILEMRVSDVKYDYPATISEEEIEWFKENIPSRSTFHYLLCGNYVFSVPEWAWDASTKSLTARYQQELRDGCVTTEFFFPMGSVKMWCDRNREMADFEAGVLWEQGKGPAPCPGNYYWVFEGREHVEVPFGLVPDTYRLIRPALTGGSQVWFKPGLGVVKETYRHQGTFIERESELVSFSKQGNGGDNDRKPEKDHTLDPQKDARK